MPTFRHAKNSAIFFNQYDLSTMLREYGWATEAETAETTAFQSTVKTWVVGIKGGTLSAGGMFAGAANEIDVLLATQLGSETDANLIVCPDGGALVLGRRCLLGQALETSYEVDGAVADIVGVSVEFVLDGGADHGYLLHPLEAESATNNETSVDWGATSTTSAGGVILLAMTANDRDAGSVVVKVQDSADDAIFADVTGGAFASVAAGVLSTQRLVLATSTSVRRYTRVVTTVTGGTTGAYTFVVGLAKR